MKKDWYLLITTIYRILLKSVIRNIKYLLGIFYELIISSFAKLFFGGNQLNCLLTLQIGITNQKCKCQLCSYVSVSL